MFMTQNTPNREKQMEPIRLIILDNEEVFREGITKLLQEQSRMDIIYHGSSGLEAIEKCNQTKPDVVLIDSHIMDCDALQTVEQIRGCSPNSKVVMLSRPDSGKNPVDFIKIGARAFLSKSISGSDLIKSIDLISSGRIIISPLFAETFIQELVFKPIEGAALTPEPVPGISPRELEITLLIAEGATNKEIAEKLFITENTTKVHVKNILNKLELKNRQQLAVYAVMKEWVNKNQENDKKENANPKITFQ
jgi:DNA-binding NarL/FixJ family response regulator